MSELDIKRFEVLQNIITRMAQNSFTIKGWAVTVVAALLALSNRESDRWFAAYALYPSIAFWGLDAYYLLMERVFRDLSRKRAEPGKEFEFTPKPTWGGFFSAAFSVTVVPLYALSIVIAILITVLER